MTLLAPQAGLTREQRRLVKLFSSLDPADRETLISFAEFLASRDNATGAAERPAPPMEPLEIPRPANETVVGALRRLRKTYPMVDPDHLLDEASGLMSAHLLGGRALDEVIDELESLFERHYRKLLDTQEK